MGLRRVWITAWEMQCCGAPFDVGSKVDWTVCSIVDPSWFPFLTAGEARRFTDTQKNHGPAERNWHDLRGRVTQIEAVHCAHAQVPGTRALEPIAGSGRFERREAAVRWEVDLPGFEFQGYAVDIAELDV